MACHQPATKKAGIPPCPASIHDPKGSLADLDHSSAGFREDRALERNETEVVCLGLSLVAQHVVEGLLDGVGIGTIALGICLLYTSPSPRDGLLSRMPSSA